MRGLPLVPVALLAAGALLGGCRSGAGSLASAPAAPAVTAPAYVPTSRIISITPVVVCPPTPEPTAAAPVLPSEARAGETWCYIRVPAVTQTLSENVLVTPASCREEWVPPVTEQRDEQVCVKPASRLCTPVAAEYVLQEEQVVVTDAKTEWRKVDCQPKNMNQGEQVGECWTLVQLPPQYATRSTRVCVRPESTREEVIPAQYATQTRTVTVREGYSKKVDVPAVFEVHTREVEVSPARWEWRRTSECDVPADAPAPGAAQPEAAPGIPAVPAYDLPPAGALPPAELPAANPPPAEVPPPAEPVPAQPPADVPPAR